MPSQTLTILKCTKMFYDYKKKTLKKLKKTRERNFKIYSNLQELSREAFFYVFGCKRLQEKQRIENVNVYRRQ